MATVNISFVTPAKQKGFAVLGDIRASENITSSGTSQTSSNTCTNENEVVRVAVSGGDIRITFGITPTATTSSLLLLDNSIEYFMIPYNSKVAVIDSA